MRTILFITLGLAAAAGCKEERRDRGGGTATTTDEDLKPHFRRDKPAMTDEDLRPDKPAVTADDMKPDLDEPAMTADETTGIPEEGGTIRRERVDTTTVTPGTDVEPTDEPSPGTTAGGTTATRGGGGGGGGGGGDTATGGAGGGPIVEPQREMTGQQLAQKYIECTGYVNAASWDAFQSNCIAEGYVGHELGAADMRGPQVIEMMKNMKAAFPDFKIEPQLVLVDGRTIVAMSLSTGTHQGPLKSPMELPATNKKIGQLFIHRLAIDEQNKAKEEWVYNDMGAFLGQLGQLPKAAGRARALTTKGIEGAPVIVVAEDSEQQRANIAVVTKLIDGFNQHKVSDATAMYTNNAVVSDQASLADAKGKKAIAAETTRLLTAFPDAKVETKEMFAAGDYVAVTARFTGTHQGDLLPGTVTDKRIKKTGKTVSVDFAELVKLENGKIAKVWRFRNGLDLALQLGQIEAGALPGMLPGATQPGVTEPGTLPGTQPGSIQPTQPGTQQPGATQPGATPGATQPGATPGATQPGSTQPGSTQPSPEPSPTPGSTPPGSTPPGSAPGTPPPAPSPTP